ncbi:MAG TPA: hypothetical protein VI792_01990, partial [Candidatus Eisenbacteria bacterium]
QVSPVLATDGAGGAIAGWVDSRVSSESDIVVQRVTGAGTRPTGWLADGNFLTGYTCYKYIVSIAEDGAGGAFLAWSDDRCHPWHNIIVAHITSAGTQAPGWLGNNGRPASQADANQDSPVIVADGAGGAYIAWEDWRSGTSAIYAQHFTDAGVVAPGWPGDGLAVCPGPGSQSLPAIASDGAGGVFIVWQDRRGGPGDIDLERLDPSGMLAPGWPAEGLVVCGAPDNQGSPAMIADGAGGVFVAWSDHRAGNDDIYAARIDAAGSPVAGWIADGTPVSTAPGDQRKPVLVADGAGGIDVAWQDLRGASWDLYAMRLAGDGTPAAGWSPDGVALCAADGDQTALQIAPDGAGGVFAAWQDPRAGGPHIYAQHVDGSGATAAGWPGDGLALCTAPGSQVSPRIVPDGSGGAIVAWVDSRTANPTAPDLYALHVLAGGPVRTGTGDLTARHQDGQTFLTWTTPPDTGWTYHVYVSDQPIAQTSDLSSATLVGSIGDSTWYDRRLSVLTGQTQAYRPDSAAAPLSPGQALFVVTPGAAGMRYYAVTDQLAGYPEFQTIATGVNALAFPVAETPAPPRPVWQRTLASPGTRPEIYTLWTSDRDTPCFPAMANRPGLAYDCGIVRGGPPPTNALFLNFHARGGDFLKGVYPTGGGPGEWVLSMDDPLESQDLSSFWYGYHESYDPTAWQNPVFTGGRVYDYTMRRTLHTLLWARRNFAVDTARVYELGFSMGAMGGFFFALQHPDLVASLIVIVGKVDFSFLDEPFPNASFNSGGGLRGVCNDLWGTVAYDLPTDEPGRVYEELNGSWLVGGLGAAAVPPLMMFSGRNDTAMGWAEKVPFFHAMRAARQGGTFYWDPRDHLSSATAAWTPMQRASDLYQFRSDRSFPALSNASPDGDPGDGSVASGDTVGTINGYLAWDSTLVDQPTRWGVTLRTRDLTMLWGPAPGPDSATVDVTPRRLQAFAVRTDSVYSYTVTRLSDHAVVQQGTVIADGVPLLTVPAVRVYRDGSLLQIQGPGVDTVAVAGVGSAAGSPRLELALAPNPARASPALRVRWRGGGEGRVDLLDTSGRIVRRVYRGPGTGTLTLRLDSQGLAGGLYFVVASQDGRRITRRLVVLR